jgi:hypothetical protein
MLNQLTLHHSDHPILPFARTQTLGIEVRGAETLGELLTRVGLHPGSAPVVVTLDGLPLADWQHTIARPGGIVQVRMAAHGGDDGGSGNVMGIVLSIALMAAGQVWGLQLGMAMGLSDVALVAGGTASMASIVGSAVISIGGQLLIRALMPAPSAKLPTGSAAMSSASPSYSLTGGQNQARPYQPFMLIFGSHRVYPDLSAKPVTEFNALDSWLYQVFNYGLVPVDQQEMRIGETPISSYADLTIVDGPNGATLPGIHQNSETIDGPGALDFNNADWNPAYAGAWSQRTTAGNTYAIAVCLAGTFGLLLPDKTEWDMCAFEVDYTPTGTGVWVSGGSITLGSKKFETVRGQIAISVTPGQYDVRVRATAGGYSTAGHDVRQRTRNPVWASLVCHQSEPVSYAGQYRVGVKIRASGQLNGTIQRWSSLCRAYTLTWNGAAWVDAHTRNPAWWYYALLKGRSVGGRLVYGGGLPDSRIDLDAIKAWGAWCDAEGLRFDAVIDAPINLQDLLARIAFAGMASPSSATGKHGIVWQDRADPAVAVFGMFNIKKGSFSVNYISENLADEIEATFVDRLLDYQAQTIRVTVPGVVGTPQRTAKIDLFGITDSASALRHARLQAAGQYYHRRRITWETDAEGLMVKRGNVVQLSHDLTQWGYSGRVVAWNAGTLTLTLERAVPRTAADTIALRWPNGCVEYLACVAGTGSSTTVVLTGALPTISSDDGTALEVPGTSSPIHDWAWQFGPQATPGKRVRIVGMTPTSDRSVKIEAVDEETGYYDWTGGSSYAPPAVFAIPNFTPYDLRASETLLRLAPGGSVCLVNLSWEGNSAATYVIRARTTRIVTLTAVPTVTRDWADIGSVTGNNFQFEASEGDTLAIEVAPFFDLNVRATYGKATATYIVLGRTAVPSNVASIAATRYTPNVDLSWAAVTDIDVPTYDVKRGTTSDTWGSATAIGTVTGTRLLTPAVNIGTWRYFVKARDVLGLTSAAATYTDIIIAAPPNVASVDYSFADTSLTSASITLDWPDVVPDLGLAHYLVDDGVSVRSVNASTITLPADWVGSRLFRVKTVDLKGNASAGIVEYINKFLPAPVSGFTAQVIDNNVLLYWTLPAKTSLPLDHVLIKRGATWGGAVSLGTKSGSFTSYQELASGMFTYWVAVVDTDGNESTPVSVTAEVAQPPDFVFNAQYASDFTGTLSSAILEAGGVVLPVNTTETWAQHFTNNAWTTPQSQIDAGYPVFIQPGTGSGYYEETFDYGTALASSKVTVASGGVTVSGSPTITTTISVSLNGSAWTDYAGYTSVYATNFRYIKVRIAVTGAGTIYRLTSLSVMLDSKLKNDAGTSAVLGADSGGTVINFNIAFIDITSLTVTPQGTTQLTAVVDFTDAPNPTSFKVLLFNSAGSRVDGTVYWSAKGY